jgi:hypothetical protein
MSTQDLLEHVRYVTDANVRKTAVQIDWELWEHLRTLLNKDGAADATTKPEQTLIPDKDAWDIFLSLGRDATPGQLPDAAARHDEYLYGRNS